MISASKKWSLSATAIGYGVTVGFTCCLFLFGPHSSAREAAGNPYQARLFDQGRGDLLLSTDRTSGSIRELIPEKYRKRYERWMGEYLSTDAGRRQWAQYAEDRSFTLTIIVSEDKGKGAEAGGYRWDASGKLVAATITLGHKLDSGYPEPGNYPVTNSLAPRYLSHWYEREDSVSGKVLAAAKIAHEFGHVNRTARMNAAQYQRQNELMPEYSRILCSNGYDVYDQRLLVLEQTIGGTPALISQAREHWAEINVLRYLQEKLQDKKVPRSVARRIRRVVEFYKKIYPERFD